jgi:hypothetical protein
MYYLVIDISSLNTRFGIKKVSDELARAVYKSRLGDVSLLEYKEKLNNKDEHRKFLEDQFALRAIGKGGRNKASLAIIDIE